MRGGFAARDLLVAPIDLRETALDRTERAYPLSEALVASARAIPGVTGVAVWSVTAPSALVKPGEEFLTIEGGLNQLTYRCRRPSGCTFPMERYGVTPEFFEVVGTRLIRGRAFGLDDRPGSPAVAIVSDQAARHWWPNADPIGQRFKIGGADSQEPWLTVVGVTADVHGIDEWGLNWAAHFPAEYFAVFMQPLSQVNLDGRGRPVWTASLLLGLRRAVGASGVEAALAAGGAPDRSCSGGGTSRVVGRYSACECSTRASPAEPGWGDRWIRRDRPDGADRHRWPGGRMGSGSD